MLNGKHLLLQLAEVRRVWRTHSVTLGTSAAAASCLRPTGRDRRGRVPSEDEHEAVSQTCLLRPRTGGSVRRRACAGQGCFRCGYRMLLTQPSTPGIRKSMTGYRP